MEFVSGSWSLPDEACTHYASLIGTFVEGHEFLLNEFGVFKFPQRGKQWLFEGPSSIPTTGWQVDSFGHSAVPAYLAMKAGFKQHIINRIDPFIKDYLVRARALHFEWQQGFHAKSSSGDRMFTHTMPYSYQGCWDCGPVKPVS